MTTEKQQKYSLMAAIFQAVMGLSIVGLWLKYQDVLPIEYLIQVANTLAIGFVISFLSWRHNSLSSKAFLEIRNRGLSSAKKNIFEDDGDFAGRYEKAFLQFNKVMLPFVLVIISLLEVVLSLRLFWLSPADLTPGNATLLVPVAVLFSFSLLSFLTGKFTSGLAHNEGHSFLKPVCGYLLYNSFTMFAAAVCALLYHFEMLAPLSSFLIASIIFSVVVAVERLLLWVVELYRPKNKSEDYNPVYESRILALFSQPKGVLGNFSTMLEYQFGIKVSESLFSSFFKKALLPFVCLQLISLFLISSLTYIKPHEKGLKMSWGDSEFSVLPPGLHLTAPWPISTVERYDVQRVKEIDLTENQKFIESYKDKVVDTWDAPEYSELLHMSAQKSGSAEFIQNLAVVNVKMSYRINDLLKYRGAYVSTEEAIKMAARETLSRVLLESNFTEVLKGGLADFSGEISKSLTESVAAEFGIEIIHVAVINFQPPPQIMPAYQSVYAASEEQLGLSIEAKKYKTELLSNTEIGADAMIKKAESETIRMKLLFDKELEAFEAQKEIYRKLPVLYRAIASMDAIENMLKNVRKFVNLTNSKKEIITLELKKATPDLLELE